MSDLSGKVAIITGATSGIGFKISSMLIEHGLKVYLIGRSFNKIKKTFLDYKDNEKINLINANLENDHDLNKIIGNLNFEKKIDILIHCAGVISLGFLENDHIDNLDKQYKVNVRAPYFITQKLLPKLKESQGDIIFLNSTAGIDTWEQISQYAASKHAMRAMADSLRKELRTNRVRVTNLFLGSVDSPMQEKVQNLKGNSYDPSQFINPAEIAKMIITILSLSNNVTITDITIRPNK